MNIGERLKRIRIEKGLTQEATANRAGVTAVSLSRWENGERKPTFQNVEKVAGALGVTMEGLTRETKPGAGCEFCEIQGRTLDVIEQTDPRIFVGLSGAYIQIYDEDYPGFIENIPINFCPICGRKL